MSETSKRSGDRTPTREPNVWTRTRWAGISSEERHLIHHSLRMLAKYLADFDADKQAATKLADEIWSLHSADVEQRDL